MKYALFDMDNTLLQGRFIDTAAGKFSFENELRSIRDSNLDSFDRTSQIATLVKGRTVQELLGVIRDIPLVEDSIDTIKELKHYGYTICIVSDSYDLVVEEIGRKIGADFCYANNLEIENNRATGKVNVPDYFLTRDDSLCQHDICKGHLIAKLMTENQISKEHILSVGDSENDICMVKNSGIGVSFCSSCEELIASAGYQITKKSFKELRGLI